VVWTQGDKLFGVDPLASASGKKINVPADGGAVQLSNLPVTAVAKHVYRRGVGEKDFQLVGSISEGKNATFLDTVATGDLSGQVLGGTPQMMDPSRSFVVSLKNVGEIRPPSISTPTTPTTPTDPEEPETEEPESVTRQNYRPAARPAFGGSTTNA
jgi:hypothetical protein